MSIAALKEVDFLDDVTQGNKSRNTELIGKSCCLFGP